MTCGSLRAPRPACPRRSCGRTPSPPPCRRCPSPSTCGARRAARSGRTRRGCRTIVSPSSSTSPWVRPAGRLVHQQERRLGGQRTGDLEPLQRAERQPGRGAERERGRGRAASSRSPARRACRGSPGRRRSAGSPDRSRPCPATVRADHHVLEQRHRREQRQVLERAGDAEPGDAVRRHVEQVLAVEPHRARRRLVDAADDVEHRRLAGTVRTDQAADLALARS